MMVGALRESLRVVVLMGGPSPEYAISLKSGQGVTAALARRGWNAQPVTVPHELSLEEAVEWTRQALRPFAPDLVFLALHGSFGEDGTIQTLCEEMPVAYTGSDAAASRLGLDKVASRQRFVETGLRVPRWRALNRGTPSVLGRERMVFPIDGAGFPLIVKPSNQGSSLGVSKVTRPSELDAAIHEAGRYSPTVLIEEYVPGREVTVGVLGTRPLPVVEIVPQHGWFDFAAKYTAGLTGYRVPAPLDPGVTPAVQAAGFRAHAAIGCRHFSRVDLILNASQQPVVLEVNTIPGFTPTSLLPKAAAAIGISYEELCERLVLMAWEERDSNQPPPPHDTADPPLAEATSSQHTTRKQAAEVRS